MPQHGKDIEQLQDIWEVDPVQAFIKVLMEVKLGKR